MACSRGASAEPTNHAEPGVLEWRPGHLGGNAPWGSVGSVVDRKWLILFAVSLGSLMSTLDGSIVNIALPAIQQEFGIDLTTIEWVVVAYLLVVGSLLLPVGRLGEVQTFKRVYLAGLRGLHGRRAPCAAWPPTRRR